MTGLSASLDDIEHLLNIGLEKFRECLLDDLSWDEWCGHLSDSVTSVSLLVENYNDRLGFELLQNSQDSIVERGAVGDIGKMVILATSKRVFVGDSGRGFTKKTVSNFRYSGNSTRKPGETTIGHKGMGLRSMMQFAKNPRFYQEGASWQYSEPLLRRRLEEILSEETTRSGITRDIPEQLSILAYPFPIYERDYDEHDIVALNLMNEYECGFVLSLDIGEKSISELVRVIKLAMRGENLLFLSRLTRLVLDLSELGENSIDILRSDVEMSSL